MIRRHRYALGWAAGWSAAYVAFLAVLAAGGHL